MKQSERLRYIMQKLRVSKVLNYAVLMMLIVGCTPTKKPTADNTPPSLTWSVANEKTKKNTDIFGTGTAYAKPNEALTITLNANDPEGLSYVGISGGWSQICEDPNGGELTGNTTSGSYEPTERTLAPNAFNNVVAGAYVAIKITDQPDCPAGSIALFQIILRGIGRNYFRGETSEDLVIEVAP